jgi:DNA-binding beta-propeller fold protein YncE
LALDEGPDSPVAYLGLWHSAAADRPGGSAKGRGSVVVLDLASGAVLDQTTLVGAPERLVLAAAPSRAGRRLYVVEGTPGTDERNPGLVGSPSTSWRLLGLDPRTLALASTLPLDARGMAGPGATGDDAPPAVAVTPDGDAVFVLFQVAARRSALVAVEAASGTARLLTVLPGSGLSGLAATDERVYVPNTLGQDVWVVARRTGRLLETVAAGPRPLGITISPPP